MTPFGQKIRNMRSKKGLTLSEMAKALQVTPAYLSALEHGKRGKPSKSMVSQICSYFNIIWDEAEKLQEIAELSKPRAVIDTKDLSSDATLLANLLANRIANLSKADLIFLTDYLGAKTKYKISMRLK